MRTSAVIALLFFSVVTFSQDGDTLSKDTADISTITKKINDNIESYNDSLNKEMIERQTQQSFDYILRMQKERRAKEKKGAIIRIAIGIGFLIILIIGLMRRRKKAKQ